MNDDKKIVQPKEDGINAALLLPALLAGGGINELADTYGLPPWAILALGAAYYLLRFGPVYILRFKKSWSTGADWLPPSMIAVALALSLFAGCATSARTEFIDADGASFTAVSKAGPFGQIDTTNQQMAYEWTADTGGFAVGQDAQGLDNSGQVAAITAAGQMLGPLISGLLSSGALSPGLPSGGGAADDPLGNVLRRVEDLCALLNTLGIESPLCPD